MFGYEFPDAEAILAEGAKEAIAAAQLPVDVTLVPEQFPDWHLSMPLIHHHHLGGSEDGPFRTDRIQFDVYAHTKDEARALAEGIKRRFTGGPIESPAGMVDSVDVEIVPARRDYVVSELALYTAIYRAETRAL